MTTIAEPRVLLPEPLRATRVIGILRRLSPDAARERIALLAAHGIRAVEITLDSPQAGATIGWAKAEHPELAVGAGTARTVEDLARAAAAGADFALSPHTDPTLVTAARELGLAYLPGSATASEAVLAWRLGAGAIKLFPAEPAGPALLAALRQPLPDIPFIPTGGVTPENAAAYFAAGAPAVALGSALTGLDDDGTARAASALLAAARKAAPWP